MTIEIYNGATVHRLWPDGSSELLAQFQYVSGADNFCQMPRDKCESVLVRVCFYSGEMRVFKQE
jgi:hypothetical protein